MTRLKPNDIGLVVGDFRIVANGFRMVNANNAHGVIVECNLCGYQATRSVNGFHRNYTVHVNCPTKPKNRHRPGSHNGRPFPLDRLYGYWQPLKEIAVPRVDGRLGRAAEVLCTKCGVTRKTVRVADLLDGSSIQCRPCRDALFAVSQGNGRQPTVHYKVGDKIGSNTVLEIDRRMPPTPVEKANGYAGDRAILCQCDCGAPARLLRIHQIRHRSGCRHCRQRKKVRNAEGDQESS